MTAQVACAAVQAVPDDIRLHFGHLVRLLAPDRVVPALTRADLQGYVDKRGRSGSTRASTVGSDGRRP